MAEMSPVDWAKRPLQKYADFSGRAPRAEYWWFYLGYIIAYIVASIVDGVLGFPVLTILVMLALILPMIAVGVRRLHDTNRTGWWLLAPLLPYLLAFVFGGAAMMSPTGISGGGLGLAMIFGLIAIALAIVVFVFTVLPGTRGPNNYGPDPYQQDVEQVFA